MGIAKCFKCQENYESIDELDLEGDGKCEKCKLESAEIAKRVDAEMAVKRASRLAENRETNQGLPVYYEAGN